MSRLSSGLTAYCDTILLDAREVDLGLAHHGLRDVLEVALPDRNLARRFLFARIDELQQISRRRRDPRW